MIFVAERQIIWPYALAMMATSVVGGYVAAHYSRQVPGKYVRWLVIAGAEGCLQRDLSTPGLQATEVGSGVTGFFAAASATNAAGVGFVALAARSGAIILDAHFPHGPLEQLLGWLF